MHDGDGAQEGVDDGAQVVAHEGPCTSFCGVNEEEEAIVWRELDQAVVQQRVAPGVEHFCKLNSVSGGNVALNDGHVYAAGCDDGTGRRGKELGFELIVWNCDGAVEDLGREVLLASYGWAGRGRRGLGEVGQREAARHGVEDIDPCRVRGRALVDSGNELSEEMANERRTGKGVREDLDGVELLQVEVGGCELLAL